ncbi:MAG: hypothetical protein QNK11_05010 [Legionella sp.]|nr:hypothetical protein [Legionella sp.]
MPENYREIDFKIADKNTKIAGMARPDFGDANAAEGIQFLSDNKYTTIISLQPSDEIKALAENCDTPIEYIEQKVKDFMSPSIDQFEAIYHRIKSGVSTPGEKVVIYCGEGFGRTGTVLAALKLKELMIAASLKKPLINEDKTSDIKLGHHAENPGLFDCTPMVKQAIEDVRGYQGSGKSVEIEAQVNQLHQYQLYLVQQLNENRYGKKDFLTAVEKEPEAIQALCKKASSLPEIYKKEALETIFTQTNEDDLNILMIAILKNPEAIEPLYNAIQSLPKAIKEVILENLLIKTHEASGANIFIIAAQIDYFEAIPPLLQFIKYQPKAFQEKIAIEVMTKTIGGEIEAGKMVEINALLIAIKNNPEAILPLFEIMQLMPEESKKALFKDVLEKTDEHDLNTIKKVIKENPKTSQSLSDAMQAYSEAPQKNTLHFKASLNELKPKDQEINQEINQVKK